MTTPVFGTTDSRSAQSVALGVCNIRRRTLLTGPGMLAGVALAGVANFGAARADSLTKEQRDALTPDELIAQMLEGNERFATGKQRARDFLAEQKASASGQYPAAVALTCVDSRAPFEIVADLGIGDTFNARVAGNAVNDDILGSMEFACAVAGAKVVVVMGHTACGAVKGAIDDVELGNLTGLLAKIEPAIGATVYDGERTSANAEFVDRVARTHVVMATREIRERSPVLAELEQKGAIKIIGSMYNLATARITLT